MIKLSKDKLHDKHWPYIMTDSLVPNQVIWMNEKEFSNLTKKMERKLNKGKNHCINCGADLPPNHRLRK